MERHGAGRIDDFTDRAKRTLALAQDEAMRLEQSYIGTEHVLLGLVREDKGAAARALASLGVELSKARAAVELLIKRTPETGPAAWRTWPTWPMGETTGLVLSLPAKKAIGNAREEAHRLGRSNVGTEHLLLGLVREGGKALEVLQSLGVPGDKVRDQVIATLGEQGPEQATPEPAEPDLLDVDSATFLHTRGRRPLEGGTPISAVSTSCLRCAGTTHPC
jgi:ATP-dependent Clp protease ATP-binding subunit ClpC